MGIASQIVNVVICANVGTAWHFGRKRRLRHTSAPTLRRRQGLLSASFTNPI
jgi:hypothetical protein